MFGYNDATAFSNLSKTRDTGPTKRVLVVIRRCKSFRAGEFFAFDYSNENAPTRFWHLFVIAARG